MLQSRSTSPERSRGQLPRLQGLAAAGAQLRRHGVLQSALERQPRNARRRHAKRSRLPSRPPTFSLSSASIPYSAGTSRRRMTSQRRAEGDADQRSLLDGPLAGSASIIGREIRLEGTPRTVVGVMPAGFRFPSQTDLWLPMASVFGDGWNKSLLASRSGDRDG